MISEPRTADHSRARAARGARQPDRRSDVATYLYRRDMDRAKYAPTGEEFWATDFKKLDPVLRERYREHLECVGCDAPAYYVPPTKRGTCFFGARPHNPGCKLTTQEGAQSTSGSLPDTEERSLSETRFRLRPHRPRSRHAHVEHDPSAPPHEGPARRYSSQHRGGASTPGVDFLSLLSKLDSDPEFASSHSRIELPGGHSTVHDYCVNVTQVTDEHVDRKKLYWGTVHRAKAAQDGGAWLYTQWDCPNVLLTKDLLDLVMEDNGMDDVEEFAGASFLELGYLNLTRDGSHTYLRPKDPEWFGIRLDTAK
jgi:hypothetical protein